MFSNRHQPRKLRPFTLFVPVPWLTCRLRSTLVVYGWQNHRFHCTPLKNLSTCFNVASYYFLNSTVYWPHLQKSRIWLILHHLGIKQLWSTHFFCRWKKRLVLYKTFAFTWHLLLQTVQNWWWERFCLVLYTQRLRWHDIWCYLLATS